MLGQDQGEIICESRYKGQCSKTNHLFEPMTKCEPNFTVSIYFCFYSAYKNTTPARLISALQKFYVNKTVSFDLMMISWIYQQGYPMVTVSLDNTTNTVRVGQVRIYFLHKFTILSIWESLEENKYIY